MALFTLLKQPWCTNAWHPRHARTKFRPRPTLPLLLPLAPLPLLPLPLAPLPLLLLKLLPWLAPVAAPSPNSAHTSQRAPWQLRRRANSGPSRLGGGPAGTPALGLRASRSVLRLTQAVGRHRERTVGREP